MSVLVLGACGEIGRAICQDLAASCGQVVLGDVREKDGRELAARLGSGASFRRVDVRDREGLARVLAGHAVVVNCIGPYFAFGTTVAEACLEAGTHYVDVCDDHDVTESLLALGGAARERGLVFLINMGASPGLTNLMARMGADGLDTVRRVRVLWYEDTGETIGLGQLMHWAHIAMGRVPTYAGGRWREVRALSQREVVTFPEPCGAVPVFHVGHPEPMTIPRFIKAQEVCCKGGILPESDITLTRVLDRVLVVKTAGTIRLLARVVLRFLPLLSGDTRGRQIRSAFRTDVEGTKGGKPVSRSRCVVGEVAALTGVPASIAAQLISGGRIRAAGVFPPEGCPDLPVETFLEELAKRGIRIQDT